MSQPYTEHHHAINEGMLRLSTALKDIQEELPHQLAQMLTLPLCDCAPTLDVLEHQLMWLAGDVARIRADLPPTEHDNER